jgi:hypothetical protein
VRANRLRHADASSSNVAIRVVSVTQALRTLHNINVDIGSGLTKSPLFLQKPISFPEAHAYW